MSLCDDNHREVCYDGRYCPVCEKMMDIKNLEEQVAALENKIEELKTSKRKEL